MLLSEGYTIDYDYLEAEGIISDYSVTEKYINSSTYEELDLNSIDKSQASIEFTNYNASCGADVVMPRAIVGINVTSLNANGNYSIFSDRKGEASRGVIKNIVLQNNIINIEQIALKYLGLRNIEIPNSVVGIGGQCIF